MEKCKAVIFDLDGVIIDSERVVIECWEAVGAGMLLEDVGATLRLCIGTTPQRTREIFAEQYGTGFQYDDLMTSAVAEFRKRKIPLKPGVHETISALHESGVTLAMGSSTPRERVIHELEQNALLPYFSHFVGGDMVPLGKPAPDIFLKAAELCGIEPEYIWVMEDSYNGIRAAAGAGMHPIMIPDMLPPTDEMHELAEKIFPSLPEAKDYLLGLIV